MADKDDLKKEIARLISSGTDGKEQTAKILSSLSENDRERVLDVLSNPAKQKELLSTPMAKKLMKQFSDKEK